MHEMSIATGLLESVLEAAAAHGGGRVEQVELDIGAMRLVVPEALEMAWSIVSADTRAAGALLETTEVPIKARCRSCGNVFSPEIADFLCRKCLRADVEILEGDDIILKAIVCDTDEGTNSP